MATLKPDLRWGIERLGAASLSGISAGATAGGLGQISAWEDNSQQQARQNSLMSRLTVRGIDIPFKVQTSGTHYTDCNGDEHIIMCPVKRELTLREELQEKVNDWLNDVSL